MSVGVVPMSGSKGRTTPLQSACSNNNITLDVVHYLIKECKCDSMH